jgi:hypothetical protein
MRNTYGNGLAALWGVPFDHLTRYAIHDFRSFSRLCGGPYRPLSFDKLVRPYQPPALYANLKGAKGAIAAQYPPPTFLASLTRLTIALGVLRSVGGAQCLAALGWRTLAANKTRNVLAPARLFDEFVDGFRLRAFEQSFKPRDFCRVVGKDQLPQDRRPLGHGHVVAHFASR